MEKIEEIVKSLFEKKENLVPLIGDEMFCYVNEEGKEIPLQKFVVEHFKDDIFFTKTDKQVFKNEETLLKEMETQGYYGMTLLYNHYPNIPTNAFKKELTNFYRTNRDNIHLNEIVKEFLVKSHYPLVITTSPFDIIEKDLKYNSSIFYDAQIGNDESIDEYDTCVFHLFGPGRNKKKTNYFTSLENGEYVTNEMELLAFLHSIHKTQPTKLIDYLKSKFLLVLGCCLPNWFFRFLLYPIHNSGEVYLINNEITSEKLDYYLHSVGYNKSCQIDKIIKALSDKIDSEVDESYENAVFLSIADEDKESAKIFKELVESEFHVKIWVFSEEIISGNSKATIKDKFQKSKYFVPFITENYLRKLSEKSGLKECLDDFGKERLKNEKERGNNDFVQPVLKDGTIWEGELVTPKMLSEWAAVPITGLIHTILNGIQIHTYRESITKNQTLVECLDSNGYKVFNKLLNNH